MRIRLACLGFLALVQTAWPQICIKNSASFPFYMTQTGRVGFGTSTPAAHSLVDVNGQLFVQAIAIGSSAVPGNVLAVNEQGIGAWRKETGATLKWKNATVSGETISLAAAYEPQNSPTTFYYAAATTRNVTYTGTNEEMTLEIKNDRTDNLGKATLRITGDLASLALQSEGMTSPLEIHATEVWPGGLTGTDNQLWLNAGIVTEGTFNRFKNNVLVGRYLNNTASGGRLVIGSSSDAHDTQRFRIRDGDSYLYGSQIYCNNLPSNNTNVDKIVMNADGKLYNSHIASSERYKEEIKPLHRPFDRLLAARSVEFVYKESKMRSIGCIAEELADLGLEDLVVRDDQDRPQGISYDRLPIYLLEIIKENDHRLQDLEKRVKNKY